MTRGRVARRAIPDDAGGAVAHIGTDTQEGVGTNRVPPEEWRAGYVISPHGAATNAAGDPFIAGFGQFGRVHELELEPR